VVTGCDDVAREFVPPCGPGAPVPVAPADSAQAAPRDPVLTLEWPWAPETACNEGLGVPVFTVQYGTEPGDLEFVAGAPDAMEVTLPLLQPETRYYWRVKIDDGAWEYAGVTVNYSPVWTFVTEGSVPVKKITWGELKDMYQR
jgi:hypothetical protein